MMYITIGLSMLSVIIAFLFGMYIGRREKKQEQESASTVHMKYMDSILKLEEEIDRLNQKLKDREKQ